MAEDPGDTVRVLLVDLLQAEIDARRAGVVRLGGCCEEVVGWRAFLAGRAKTSGGRRRRGGRTSRVESVAEVHLVGGAPRGHPNPKLESM